MSVNSSRKKSEREVHFATCLLRTSLPSQNGRICGPLLKLLQAPIQASKKWMTNAGGAWKRSVGWEGPGRAFGKSLFRNVRCVGPPHTLGCGSVFTKRTAAGPQPRCAGSRCREGRAPNLKQAPAVVVNHQVSASTAGRGRDTLQQVGAADAWGSGRGRRPGLGGAAGWRGVGGWRGHLEPVQLVM